MALAAARGIVKKDGLRGLTARGVAREIGYSIGTIYNVFENLDDLIIHLNATTLDQLYEMATSAPVEKDPEAALRTYAQRYIAFTSDNQRLWNAMIEYQRPEHQVRPAWYDAKVMRLLSLLEETVAPFFGPDEETLRLHNARVLWSSMHGICSLAQRGGLHPTESAVGLADTLITHYLAGLQKRRPAPPRPRKAAGRGKSKRKRPR